MIAIKIVIEIIADVFSFLTFLHTVFSIELTNNTITADQIKGDIAITKVLNKKTTLSKFAHKK